MLAYRTRRAAGRRVYRVELDAVAIESLLVAAGLLPETVEVSHEQVERGIERLIEMLPLLDASRRHGC
jgi:hypothetical protein